jgi:hypothetical protein
VKVATIPAGAKAPVAVYRSVSGKNVRLSSATLDRYGRLDKVLAKQFKRGSKVTLYTIVKTTNGTYVSKKVTITIK